MTDEISFGDQLEAGLTDAQLMTNAKTWRHIWFIQRFMLHATDQFLHRATAPGQSAFSQKRDTLIGLLHSVCAVHGTASNHDVYYEVLENDLKDAQLIQLMRNTRQWLNTHYTGFAPATAIAAAMHQRCLTHDQSKLVAPEVQTFTDMTAKLGTVAYGSEEYKGFLKEMKPALDNHYAQNRHHPEHFGNGLADMNLIDALEMLCDWAASSLRTKGGDVLKSLEIQKDRFGMSDALVDVLRQTHEQFLAGEYRRDPKDFYSQKGL